MSENNQLITLVEKTGLEPAQQKPLLDGFGDMFVQAHKLVAQSKAIKVTSIDQVAEMKKAHEFRMKLQKIRTDADKARISLKEGYLRGANAVQGIFNDIKDIVKTEEERLLEQEKFAERVEAERKNKIEAQRATELSKYVENVEVYSLHPDKLSQESFDQLLKTSKFAFEAQKEAERLAEEARVKAEQEEKAEQERIRVENEKLKKEAEKREAEIAKEKAKQETIIEAERKAKKALEDKIEADRLAKLKAEADQKRIEEEAKAAKEKAERDALLAPDKEKLFQLANQLNLIDMPLVKSANAKAIVGEVELKLSQLAEFIRNSKL